MASTHNNRQVPELNQLGAHFPTLPWESSTTGMCVRARSPAVELIAALPGQHLKTHPRALKSKTQLQLALLAVTNFLQS